MILKKKIMCTAKHVMYDFSNHLQHKHTLQRTCIYFHLSILSIGIRCIVTEFAYYKLPGLLVVLLYRKFNFDCFSGTWLD